MSNIILLTNNQDNINLINVFLDDLTPLQTLTHSYKIIRILELSINDNIETCKGIVKLSNIHIEYKPEFTKIENMNYTSSIITDTEFINNLLFFVNDYSNEILDTTIIINNISYKCNKFIDIADKNYYILEQI